MQQILGRAGAGASAAVAPERDRESDRDRLIRQLVTIVERSGSFSERERAQMEVENTIASLDEIAAVRTETVEDNQRLHREWESRIPRMYLRVFLNALNDFTRMFYGVEAEIVRAEVGPGAAAAGAGGDGGGGGRGRARSESDSDDEDVREAKRRSLQGLVEADEEDAALQAALAASLRAGAQTDDMLLHALRQRPDLRFSHNNAAMRVCRRLGLRKCIQFLADNS